MRFLRSRGATLVGVFLLVLSPLAAGAEGENPEAAPPDTTTPGVVLEEPAEDLAVAYQGLEARARYTGAGYVVELRNPGLEPREVDLEIHCVSWSGSLVARMGPLPRVVGQERQHVIVAAGQTAEIRVGSTWPAIPDPTPTAVGALMQDELFVERVQRVQLLLRPPGQEPPEMQQLMPTLVPDPSVAFLTPRRTRA
jgi:hypothetical protein